MLFRLMNKNGFLTTVLLAALLMGMDSGVPEDNERRQLAEKEAQLSRRIKSLRQEQDFLLFQKSYVGSDSKYLIVDLIAGRGTLKYRNRTLRTFRIIVPPVLGQGLRNGRYLLTAKTDGSAGNRSLVFGDSFSVHGRGFSGAIAGERKLPGLVIGKRDLAALFYTMEKGTMLYIH